ncbi:MAG: diacylglycerol kinase [Gammaproteobacteria bacterium]|nr:diacylglycerol kinase [Gammaproteobacteria bacterium]
MANRNQGFMRIVYAAGYSWQGLRAAWKNEAAFRQELMLFIILAPVGYWLGETGVERAILIGSLMLVLIVEILNSAIEAVVDRFGEEQHELSGRAKDMGSAAVFLSLLAVLVMWPLILCEKFF